MRTEAVCIDAIPDCEQTVVRHAFGENMCPHTWALDENEGCRLQCSPHTQKLSLCARGGDQPSGGGIPVRLHFRKQLSAFIPGVVDDMHDRGKTTGLRDAQGSKREAVQREDTLSAASHKPAGRCTVEESAEIGRPSPEAATDGEAPSQGGKGRNSPAAGVMGALRKGSSEAVSGANHATSHTVKAGDIHGDEKLRERAFASECPRDALLPDVWIAHEDIDAGHLVSVPGRPAVHDPAPVTAA